MKQLADHVQAVPIDNILAATECAKVHARTLLDDQGIAMLALLLADVLADTLEQGMIVTYDQHSQDVADHFSILTAG